MARQVAYLGIVLMCCCSACESDSVIEVGIINYFGESNDVVEAPRSVAIGQRFMVTVNTYGAGCNWAESMSVDSSDDYVALTPYDGEDVAHPCRLETIRIPHTAEIEFPSRGSKTLTVFGRSVDQQRDTLVELTHEITVEPE